MPYKVGRISNKNGSGKREVPPSFPLDINETLVLKNDIVKINNNELVVNEVLEEPVNETLVLKNDIVKINNNELVVNEVLEEPVNETLILNNPENIESNSLLGLGVEPLFNEDKSKVLNPLTNRYVKVGGDIDKKLNLSQIILS